MLQSLFRCREHGLNTPCPCSPRSLRCLQRVKQEYYLVKNKLENLIRKGIHRRAFTSFHIFLSDRRRLADDYSAQTWRILMNCFSCINPRRKAIKIDIDNAIGCSTFRNSSFDPSEIFNRSYLSRRLSLYGRHFPFLFLSRRLSLYGRHLLFLFLSRRLSLYGHRLSFLFLSRSLSLYDRRLPVLFLSHRLSFYNHRSHSVQGWRCGQSGIVEQ
ncbi:hypothetical protein LINPERHAP2_LOCUS22745 [Linum perenne]